MCRKGRKHANGMIKVVLSCKFYCFAQWIFGTNFEKNSWPNIFIWLLDSGALKRFQVYPSPLYLSDMRYANTSRKLLKLRPFEFCLVYFKTLKVQRFIKFQSFFCLAYQLCTVETKMFGMGGLFMKIQVSLLVCVKKSPEVKGGFIYTFSSSLSCSSSLSE